MKKIQVLFFFIILFSATGFSQEFSAGDLKTLNAFNDTLGYYAKDMIFNGEASTRFHSDSVFIKNLVQALKIPYSYYYPFDSIKTVSILYPPDSSFRIFSWQIQRDESYYRQFGAIQMNTKDGSLQLHPLHDMSDYTASLTDSVRHANSWVGAIYYGLIQKTYNGKKYYTLLGFDDNDFMTTRKWIEVMTFDLNNKPVFGGKFFAYKEDNLKPSQPAYRFCLEYKKDGRARMIYDTEMDMIVFDHLISETGDQQKKFTLIPDGDYEGFKWQDGKWIYIEKVFENQNLRDGQAPVPKPFYDDNGNPIEQ